MIGYEARRCGTCGVIYQVGASHHCWGGSFPVTFERTYVPAAPLPLSEGGNTSLLGAHCPTCRCGKP